jgi:hypothetical protein
MFSFIRVDVIIVSFQNNRTLRHYPNPTSACFLLGHNSTDEALKTKMPKVMTLSPASKMHIQQKTLDLPPPLWEFEGDGVTMLFILPTLGINKVYHFLIGMSSSSLLCNTKLIPI